jgi:hypothetical protein
VNQALNNLNNPIMKTFDLIPTSAKPETRTFDSLRKNATTRGPFLLGIIACLSFVSTGCRQTVSIRQPDGGLLSNRKLEIQAAAARILPIRLDPGLTEDQMQVVLEDLQNYERPLLRESQSELVASNALLPYQHLFGDARLGGGVLRYLGERVYYIMPTLQDANEPPSNPSMIIMATNIGAANWATAHSILPVQFRIRVGGIELPSFANPRVGLIELGSGYRRFDPTVRGTVPDHSRRSTLLHEARHSDCEGLDAEAASLGRTHRFTAGSQCTHSHSECPTGHVLAGIPACDNHAWGPYSVGFAYSMAQLQKCVHERCNERDLQFILMDTVENEGRISLNPDARRAALLQRPNLAASNRGVAEGRRALDRVFDYRSSNPSDNTVTISIR